MNYDEEKEIRKKKYKKYTIRGLAVIALTFLLEYSMEFLLDGIFKLDEKESSEKIVYDVSVEESYSEESNNKTQSTSEKVVFDKYNILTFGDIEVDDSLDYQGDEYIDIKSKVTNNSSEIIKTVSVDFYFYDDENTIIDSTHPQEGSSIEGNQSFYIDASYMRDLNVGNVKINTYSYYIGDTFYIVDLLSRTVQVYN